MPNEPHEAYILAVDQSTSGTKALLFNQTGRLTARADRSHRQIIDERGWVEHDPEEIYQNLLDAVREVLETACIKPEQVAAAGISNQRETGMMWGRDGRPVYNAIVWQCARGAEICEEIKDRDLVRERTGLQLSPYFTAAKLAWILRKVPKAAALLASGELLAGTMDSWVLYRLTGNHLTDYSNASRTQLFNIHTLSWDRDVCGLFGIPESILPQVQFSNSSFGSSDFGGVFPTPIPILGVLGDSHAALFAQGCLNPGDAKVTYGTGSSVMINTGDKAVDSEDLVTSLAWGIDGKINYVLEGNINYTGAVISWLVHDVELLESSRDAERIAAQVPNTDGVYLVPAFSGLGAPHWDSGARAILCGMNRGTRKAHIVRAAEESIAYQITDVVRAAARSGVSLSQIRADGGPTHDSLLMQFQADMLRVPLSASRMEELSGAGAAYAAGLAAGIYTWEQLASIRESTLFEPEMNPDKAEQLYSGWQSAVKLALTK